MNKLQYSFTDESLRRRRPHFAAFFGRKSGQALIIVLGFVALMTVLVLVFFESVTTERTSAKAAASGESARQLAQSAVQLVEGTITKATVPTYDTTIAWASQPGMIRTYGTPSGTAGTAGTPSSSPLAYYKLYSSSNMVINSSSTLPVSSYTVDADVINGGDLLSNWSSVHALYTDINAPTTASDGTIVFPIVDPRAVSGSAAVAGFFYSNSTPTSTVTLKPADFGTATSGGGTGSLLPMPVQWIYVLRDGTLTSPTEPTNDPAPGTNVANFGGANPPSATNPIVGRIAFWTDDDCSKVNLNTASEGTYWDTPIANSGNVGTSSALVPFTYSTTTTQTGQTVGIGDAIFGFYIPAQHEYQRYPGHPATTCLSEVLGSLFTTGSPSRSAIMTQIDAATPRVSDTGAGGTGTSTEGGTLAATAVLQPNFNRLYATVDDFNFLPSRTAQNLNGTAVQIPVEQSRFFLTTQSKSPDLNPLYLPRVTIWPVWDDADSAKRTTLDQSMYHCSTVANGAAAGSQHRMIFTRKDPTSPTTDWTLTDANGNPRNKELFEYLQTLTNRAIPGFGGNLATKYSSAPVNTTTDIDQILAEIYDYIRCTNLADQSVSTADSYTPCVGTPITVPNQMALAGYVALGNNLRIHYSTFNLVINGQTITNSTPNTILDLYEKGRIGSSTRDSLIGGAIGWINMASSAVNQTGWTGAPADSNFPTGLVVLNNSASTGCVNASASPAPATTLMISGSFTVQIYAGNVVAGQMAPVGSAAAGNLVQTLNFTVPQQTVPIPQLCTVTYTPPPPPPPAPSPPAVPNVWIGTFRGDGPSSQIVTYPEPPASPTYTYANLTSGYTWPQTGPPAKPATFAYTAAYTSPNASKGPRLTGFYNFTGSGDVIRSVVATGTLTSGGPNLEGDMRLIAASNTVSATAFNTALTSTANGVPPTVALPSSTTFAADSMRNGTVFSTQGMAFSSLAAGQSWSAYTGVAAPAVPLLPNPSSATTTTAAAGLNCPQMTGTGDNTSPPDWDNGPGLLMDGPYCNKPDEGQQGTGTAVSIAYIENYDSTVNDGYQPTLFFSPNREVSSPVMFGSLPVGLDHPWRTLLFHPANLPGYQETAGTSSYTHPGGSDPTIPDHLLLDFFRMPVVEPYSISEPLATAGKINLNTQIAPFTYITRNTGMRAVMKSVMITALNPTAGSFIGVYKNGYLNDPGTSNNSSAAQFKTTTRYPIDLTDTLAMLNPSSPDANSNGQTAFPEFTRTTYTAAAPNFFISPSQICDLPLIPIAPLSTDTTNAIAGLSGPISTISSGAVSLSGLGTFWAANSLTGDNSLDRPYSLIYPRVTTQSNTFTIHVRAQSLQKLPSAAESPTTWTEGTDQITGEYRGSFTVEKYFDPSYAVITDSSGNVQADTSDATLPTTAAIRGDNNNGTTNGASTLVHGALWRLLYDKRFGQ